MQVLRRIVIITSVFLSSVSDSFSPAARRSSFFSSWPDLLKLPLLPNSFSFSSCEYYDRNKIWHLSMVPQVKVAASEDLVNSLVAAFSNRFTCLISGGAASGSAKSGLSSILTSTVSSSSVKVSSCSQSSPGRRRFQHQTKMHM